LEVNGLPPFQVVYNGIDPQQFNASPPVVENLREKLGLTGRKVILFAGRLTPHKGSLQLLAALEKVIEHVPQATVLALSRASLEEQVPQYRHWFGKHLVSGGWLEGETLAAAYQLVSVAVMPSITFESFGMVSLEAMAARKPVICTCFGAPPEVVQDGVTGFVVNPFDTAAFASALERLLTDDALAQKMGSAGYERMTQHFSLQRQLDAMLQVYGSGLR
jgi:spore coat protein SA